MPTTPRTRWSGQWPRIGTTSRPPSTWWPCIGCCGSRLGPAYQPARHLGGAIYFFLRGVEGPTRGCYLVPPDPKLLDGIDLLLRATEGAEE